MPRAIPMITALALFIVLAPASPARACRCADPHDHLTVVELSPGVSVMFIGSVVRHEMDPAGASTLSAIIKVEQVLIGSLPRDHLVLAQLTNCDVGVDQFPADTRWVFFGENNSRLMGSARIPSPRPANFTVSTCGPFPLQIIGNEVVARPPQTVDFQAPSRMSIDEFSRRLIAAPSRLKLPPRPAIPDPAGAYEIPEGNYGRVRPKAQAAPGSSQPPAAKP